MATRADLTPGTVLVFTRDLTFLGPFYREYRPGPHFVVWGLSESGYTFDTLNTRTGRRHGFMAERWVLENMRVVGRGVGLCGARLCAQAEEEEGCYCTDGLA